MYLSVRKPLVIIMGGFLFHSYHAYSRLQKGVACLTSSSNLSSTGFNLHNSLNFLHIH